MADIKVKIKRKLSGAGWDTLFPQTTVDQIKLNTNGDALSAFSTKILEKANPSAVSFVKVQTNGDVDYRNATQLIGDLGAAPAVHNHTQIQVVNLVDDLADKADLDGGKVLSSQIPDYLFSGLKFAGTAGGASPTTLAALITAANTALGASTDLQREGAYFVASSDFELGAGSGTHTIIGGGDEGDATLPITLEKGDWIVYLGYNGSAHEWSIVNNTYRNAEIGNVTGVVALSPGTVETRAALSQTSSGLLAMDEFAVRKVMKDIFYTSDESALSGVETGDLAFVSASF
jgi:hypothetical protein